MVDQFIDRRIMALAQGSPTALAAALERAIATGNRELERAALEALGELGIVLVDRGTLADALGRHREADSRRRRRLASGPSVEGDAK